MWVEMTDGNSYMIQYIILQLSPVKLEPAIRQGNKKRIQLKKRSDRSGTGLLRWVAPWNSHGHSFHLEPELCRGDPHAHRLRGHSGSGGTSPTIGP